MTSTSVLTDLPARTASMVSQVGRVPAHASTREHSRRTPRSDAAGQRVTHPPSLLKLQAGGSEAGDSSSSAGSEAGAGVHFFGRTPRNLRETTYAPKPGRCR